MWGDRTDNRAAPARVGPARPVRARRGRRVILLALPAVAALAGLLTAAVAQPATSTRPPLGAAGSTSAASAAGSSAAAALRQRVDALVSAPPPGLRALRSGESDNGIQFDPIESGIRKAKVLFQFPPLTLRSYLRVCIISATFNNPCPGHNTKLYPKLSFDYSWDVAFVDNWVATRSGGTLRFGVFPDVRVSLLAFGAIPVTATVHIAQTKHNGVFDPITLWLPVEGNAVPPGSVIPGFGPAPEYKTGPTFFQKQGISTSTVDIRISDVTIDGQPLDVGPSCRTSKPAFLRLTTPGGYYPAYVSPTKLRGKPGGFQPLGAGGPAGYLDGSANIPAFAGCHNGSENLDALFTGTVSGTNNVVRSYSPHGLQSWCVEKIARCGSASTTVQQALLDRTPAQLGRLAETAAGRALLTRSGGTYRRPAG